MQIGREAKKVTKDHISSNAEIKNESPNPASIAIKEPPEGSRQTTVWKVELYSAHLVIPK